jgi:hypothetical protein
MYVSTLPWCVNKHVDFEYDCILNLQIRGCKMKVQGLTINIY